MRAIIYFFKIDLRIIDRGPKVIKPIGLIHAPHNSMMNQPPQSLEEIEAERRRQRWGYFWTPFITMASVVSSIAMLMFLIKSCDERGLPRLLVPATSALHEQGALEPPKLEPNERTGERAKTSIDKPPQATESQRERTSPAQ